MTKDENIPKLINIPIPQHSISPMTVHLVSTIFTSKLEAGAKNLASTTPYNFENEPEEP